ncbi:SMC-Scp complex subunit ScpB [Carnimonas bestiolae]|uniref:SMC-Scp complex subunit ScpB n=1 Tax=Carnimonas bestiolae TaxID=3402172 RepID=UPI003EDC8599
MSDPTASLDRIVEGALLASSSPLSLDQLEQLFDEHERPTRGELRAALAQLERRLEGSAMALLESASGFRLAIDHSLSRWVSRLWEERPQRYSRALLETLALIAYRQPVTRSDIEEIRGVSISATIMRTLMERSWIRVVGHRDVPGRPAVYATTRSFLDDLGLGTLEELPPMAELAERFGEETPQEQEDAEANAAQQATQALLQSSEDDADAQDDDSDPLNEPLPQIATLDFGHLNERLDERLKQRVGDGADTHNIDDADDDQATPSGDPDSRSDQPTHDERSFDNE